MSRTSYAANRKAISMDNEITKFQQIEQKIVTKLKLWQTLKAVFQTRAVYSMLDVYQNRCDTP